MKPILLLTGFVFVFGSLFAQIENVVVEKYYISDANDAKNIQYIYDIHSNITDSVYLEPGTTAYRVFVQLKPDHKLTKIFGDQDHPLKILSSEVFFNNTDLGVSFGKDLISSRLQYNSVALDSWLTLGLASRTYSGILKPEDTDGSVVGGSMNSDGMLVSKDPLAGIPITESDGLALAENTPGAWLQSGIVDNDGNDSTIFGSLKKGKQFVSNNAFFQCSGATGTNSGNYILVAQLTTQGEISFELNIQVQKTDGSSTVNFVAKQAAGDESKGYVYNSLLSYPREPVCGCKDANYLEFNPNADCNVIDSCKTKLNCGCMDPLACNYDPTANCSIPSLCCYPGSCADRDISVVCPNLPVEPKNSFLLYPNPVNNQLRLEVTTFDTQEVRIEIYNSYGRLVLSKNLGIINGTVISDYNMVALKGGLYLARIHMGSKTETKAFIKN